MPYTRIIITAHAREKMQARNVSFAEIEETLKFPEIVEPDNYGPDRRKFKRGELAIVVAPSHTDPEALVVLTILWRTPEAWSDEQMKGR